MPQQVEPQRLSHEEYIDERKDLYKYQARDAFWLTPEFKKCALSLRIGEHIGKAIGKMCNLEGPTGAIYHVHFFIR